jgi:ribonucleotide monophosphatase NagD (HAD superfamily)
MVADLESDVLAGLNAGCRSILVRSGQASDAEVEALAGRFPVAADLAAAVDRILGTRGGRPELDLASGDR